MGNDRREPRSRVRSAESGIPRIWIQKALEWGQVREYWDDADIDELEALTLNAWRVLSAVVEAHSAQEEAELGADDDDDD